MEKSRAQATISKKLPTAQQELRTLELWRSVISECLASFLYVFIVCGAASTSAAAGSFPQTVFATAAASGLAVAVLTYCFQHLSGAHINPAISAAMSITRKITPLRGSFYVIAQVGGAIAGAALLYGVSVPAHYGNINATISQIPTHMLPWEKFSTEFVLSFLVIFAYCAMMTNQRKWIGSSAICIGLAYLAAGLVAMPSLNPARAFGPAFVMNRWEHHWVFWLGPCTGGVAAALVYEIIFVAHKRKSRSDMSVDGDSASMHSEADTYDELEKQRTATLRSVRGSLDPYHRQIVSHNTGNSCCGTTLYPSSHKGDRSEPIYEGSRSLYTRSPPLTRANLSRSQSVYTKVAANSSAGGGQRDASSRQGPHLTPSQSMYPTIASNPLSQNHQNQQRQQGSEGTYGRSVPPPPVNRDRENYMKGRDPIYVKKQQPMDCSTDSIYGYHHNSSVVSSKSVPVHVTRKECQNIASQQQGNQSPPQYYRRPQTHSSDY